MNTAINAKEQSEMPAHTETTATDSDTPYATSRYQQEMVSIWEQVIQLPEGQDKVVLSQLWQLGQTSAAPTPEDFPALVAHGFIIEQLLDSRLMWRPVAPSLKEFWRVGITVSNAHGYMLQPKPAFEANLFAHIQLYNQALAPHGLLR